MTVMDALQIEIIFIDQISAELDKQMEQLVQLAYAHDDSENIEWSSHIEWMAIGRLDSELVTLLGLLRHEILVGGKPVWVAGVGGVGTHPNWQKRGLASRLMQASEIICVKRWMRPLVCCCALTNSVLFTDAPAGNMLPTKYFILKMDSVVY